MGLAQNLSSAFGKIFLLNKADGTIRVIAR
jgi:hypothetical protein